MYVHRDQKENAEMAWSNIGARISDCITEAEWKPQETIGAGSPKTIWKWLMENCLVGVSS